jgi:hypothetical protein
MTFWENAEGNGSGIFYYFKKLSPLPKLKITKEISITMADFRVQINPQPPKYERVLITKRRPNVDMVETC